MKFWFSKRTAASHRSRQKEPTSSAIKSALTQTPLGLPSPSGRCALELRPRPRRVAAFTRTREMTPGPSHSEAVGDGFSSTLIDQRQRPNHIRLEFAISHRGRVRVARIGVVVETHGIEVQRVHIRDSVL